MQEKAPITRFTDLPQLTTAFYHRFDRVIKTKLTRMCRFSINVIVSTF